MASGTPLLKQRQMWTVVMALAALAFWVVGLGAGWRGWILAPNDGGIVAHAQSFGIEAFIWWTPATVLTLTTVLMAIGIAVVRQLVGDSEDAVPTKVSRNVAPGVAPASGKDDDGYDVDEANVDEAE